MEQLLIGLKLNHTVVYQLISFIIVYAVLHFVLFVPYYNAFSERVKRTMGQTELAEQFIVETRVLQAEYEQKAKHLAQQYRTIFDESRARAQKEYDQKVSEARETAKTELEAMKAKIVSELESAREEAKKEIPGLVVTITSRLLGREAN